MLSTDWVRERQVVIERLVKAIEEGMQQPPHPEADEDEVEDCWDEFDDPAPVAENPPPPSGPEKPAPAAAQEGKRYLEFVGGASRKFWEIDRMGNTLTVRFGRIGTSGQTQQKIFADEATAITAAQRLLREKLGKGYVEKSGQNGSV